MRYFMAMAFIMAAAAAGAAEGGAAIRPAPGSEPPTGPTAAPPVRSIPPGMAMGRAGMSFEVEALIVKPGDAAALAAWAELAAVGYHVVAAVPGDGQTTLMLERPNLGGGAAALRLPAGIDAAQAAGVRQRIEAALQERQRAAQPPQRANLPAPVGTGAEKR